MPTRLASIHSDGRPLDLAAVAEFIADLAAAGVPATTPLLFELADPYADDPAQPAVTASALVTDDQAAAMPEHVDITTTPADLDNLQEV